MDFADSRTLSPNRKLVTGVFDPHREWNRGLITGFRRSLQQYEDSRKAFPNKATQESSSVKSIGNSKENLSG